MSGVKRDRDWVQREYGTEKWPAVLGAIQTVKDNGERDLCRALYTVNRLQRPLASLESADCVVDGKRCHLPFGVAWEARQGVTAEVLMECVQPDTSLVVELGSGWGFNLLQFWCKGGPRSARYVAAEFTEAGRACTEQLALLEPDLKLSTAALDYHNPKATDIQATDGHALVFSCQSLEQIPQVQPGVIEMILGLGERVTCIHVEPVGWQIEAGKSTERNRAYAEQHDYNRNLWSVLGSLEADGALEIKRSFPDFLGVNPDNPVTLIEWRRK